MLIRYSVRMRTAPARTLVNVRLIAGLSRRQAAILADVSPSTVTRIENGTLTPSVDVFERLLAVCGVAYGQCPMPYVDLEALRAARRLLSPDAGINPTEESDSWERKWAKAGLLSAPSQALLAKEVAFRGAQQCCLSARPGAQRYEWRDWRNVAEALEASGGLWALSGGYGALYWTGVASVDWAVFYVEDVGIAAELAGLRPSSDPLIGPRITLIPFDDVTRTGVSTAYDGLRLADFWQVVIDCFAGNGRMPDQAEAMIDGWASAKVPA